MPNMKSTLLKALQKDLEDALIKIDQRDAKIAELQRECRIHRDQADEIAANYFRLQFKNEDLEMQLKRAKKDAEWWREQDEDEDYQASLEIAAMDDIPLEEGEDEEEGDFVWPNSSMQVEPD